MAVDENPARKLEPAEIVSRKVDLAKSGGRGIAAEIGGKVVLFAGQTELDNFVRQQVEWEGKIGPIRPEENAAAYSPWTEGLKTVLFIRVDFPDRPGAPVDHNDQPLTLADAQNLMDTQVSPFYVSNSYNKTRCKLLSHPWCGCRINNLFTLTRLGHCVKTLEAQPARPDLRLTISIWTLSP